MSLDCTSLPSWHYLPLKTHFVSSNCFSLWVRFLSRFSCSLARPPKPYHSPDDVAVWLILSGELKDLFPRQCPSLRDSVLLLLVKINHSEHGRGNYQHEQGVPWAVADPSANQKSFACLQGSIYYFRSVWGIKQELIHKSLTMLFMWES